MKTLFVSDLDGTLLGGDAKLSIASRDMLNALIKEGLCFSIATQRSHYTVGAAIEGLNLILPQVLMGGALIGDARSGQMLSKITMPVPMARALTEQIQRMGMFPCVFTQDALDRQRIYHMAPKKQQEHIYLGARRLVKDDRLRQVTDFGSAFLEEIYFVIAVHEAEEELLRLGDIARQMGAHCHLYNDVYTGQTNLEICAPGASKGARTRQLANMLGCERLVVFGDNYNDLSMFEAADECYAVANAQPEVRLRATATIGKNDQDGVARYLFRRMYEKGR